MVGSRCSLEIAPGARAAEERVLERLEALRDAARRDPLLLARPVRVVVPSGSLRLHLGERVAARLGATAGVVLQTLHGAAVEVLERRGLPVGGGDELVELHARRHARAEPALRDAFELFRDGYRAVAGSVRDLLDAGLEPALAEAVDERLRAARHLPADERERARATARVAVRVAAELAPRGAGGRAELLRRAREAFEADPEAALPARELLVHGFADATGAASELIEALARRLPGTVLVDHPPDPDAPDRPDLGRAFTERLRERLAGALGPPRELPAPASAAPAAPRFAREAGSITAPRFARAPGPTAEARHVARRVRELLDEGARPERIGIVARDLGPYRAALRAQLGRLGVPFSGLRARAPLDGAGRRVHALLDVLESREHAPVDRWLDALAQLGVERDGRRERRLPSARLRLGLRVVGAARLGEAARLVPEELLDDHDQLRLPVRSSVAGGDDDGENGATRFHARQERLHGDELRAGVRAARALVRRLARWPERAPLERHAAELAKLVERDLGWRARGPRSELERVRPALERLAGAYPDEELAREELVLLARRALAAVAAPALGGAGGGVQVLEAMEARARTFDDLFVLGLNRDVFPRPVREDALLSDDARRALADLLPDVPIKGRGRDEDRYLFAQLASSAGRLSLSWLAADDDGKPQVASPLVERLLGETPEEAVEAAAPVFPLDPDVARRGGPRPAREHAVLAGLTRDLDAERLELALAEAGTPDAGTVAGARRRVLEAHERGPFEPERLAPWLGFLGSQAEVGVRPDPRSEAQYVTRFEDVARCPWQTVLTKLLRMEDLPDPLDRLPGVEARQIGNVVHAVLEDVARETLGDARPTLAEALAGEPRATPWPAPERFEALLREATERVLRREGRPRVAGLVRMVAECARPLLERARELQGEDERALGVEVEGRASVELPDGSRLDLVFRADRVDRLPDGRVVLTDYKTGKPAEAREVRQGVPRGGHLQPLAYALGASIGESEVRGRLRFLKAEPGAADVGPGKQWKELVPDFTAAVGAIARAWEAGSFFPRLYDDAKEREPQACEYCEVASACLRRDSGARRALVAWAGGTEPADGPVGSLRELWALANAEPTAAAPAPARRRRKAGR